MALSVIVPLEANGMPCAMHDNFGPAPLPITQMRHRRARAHLFATSAGPVAAACALAIAAAIGLGLIAESHMAQPSAPAPPGYAWASGPGR